MRIPRSRSALARWTSIWCGGIQIAVCMKQSTLLTPFVGYWVKANKSTISLIISPPIGRSVQYTRAAKPAPRVASNNWKLRIAASAGGTTDGFNFLGVSPEAKDDFDVKDVEK